MEIIRLKTLIAKGKDKEDKSFTTMKLEEMLKTFKCARNTNVENYLKNTAVMHENQHIANTYLILDGSKNAILAFFTLAPKRIDISSYSLKPKEVKKYTGSSDIKNSEINSVHLAQLAKNDNARKPIQGNHLWQSIYTVLEQWEAPFRIISLDCKKELIDYYSRFGFISVGFVSLIKRYTMIKKRDVVSFTEELNVS